MHYTIGAVKRIEWQTVLLSVVIYSGWLALTSCWNRLSPWLILPIGAWLGAWFMSLQHEVIHRHPTRNQAINDAIGFAPLMVWMPYARYKATHLQHHRDEWLTDPLEDPESAYHTAQRWNGMGPFARGLHLVGVTFPGRLLLGPFLAMWSFWKSEIRLIAAGEPGVAQSWAAHLAGLALMVWWLVAVCHVSLLAYAVLVVWPGTGLALLRSLAEHKAAARPEDRIAIVENGGLLGILFLHNNLHVVHHLYPGLPWYRMRSTWRALKPELMREYRGPFYRSYGQVAAQFLTTPHNRGALLPAGFHKVEHRVSERACAEVGFVSGD